MISGMYLGEIARRVLHRIAVESEVFEDAGKLAEPFSLRYYLCYIFLFVDCNAWCKSTKYTYFFMAIQYTSYGNNA